MPDIVTHTYFAHRVFKQLEEMTRGHVEDQALYQFAAGGPDPFFFYRFLRKTDNKSVRAIGNRMHKEATGDFFMRLLEEIRNVSNRDVLFSYFAGLVTHYALDAFVHPYVFHKTGVYDEEDPKDLTYRGLHTKLERAIDCYIIRNHFHCKPNTFKIHKRVLVLKKIPREIWENLDRIYMDVYGIEEASKIVDESVRCQKRFYRFIFDPTGMKNALFKMIDKKTTGLDYTVLSYYNKEITDRDILNIKGQKWTNPLDKHIESKDSVFALFEKAEHWAVQIIEAAYRFAYMDEELDMTSIIENRSYLTGLDLSNGHEMKYFNNIFA